MRFTTPIRLAIVVGHGTASPLLNARHTPDAAPAMIPVQKAIKIESIKPSIPRPGVKATRIRYGPYKLRVAGTDSPAQGASMISMDPGGTTFSYRTDADFPKDITVLISKTQLVFEDGTLATIKEGIYNHHTIFSNTNKTVVPILGCAESNATSAANPAVIAGAEEGGVSMFTTQDGKFNSGYYVGKDDAIIIAGDVVNYNKEEKTVYTLSEIEYIPGKVAGSMEAGLQIIELGQCAGTEVSLHPPSGKQKWSLAGPEMAVQQDGYFVSARGHLHDGGVNLVVKFNGKAVCNSEAVYGGEGKTTKSADDKEWTTIGSMTPCPAPIKLSKGDKVAFEANYDLEKHPAQVMAGGMHAEEMATLIGYFAVGA